MISTSVHLLWLKSYGSATSLGKFLTEALASLSDICESEKSKHCSLSHVQLFVTPWTVTHHAPLSTGFSRQKYWKALPFPSLGAPRSPGIEPASPESPASQADSLLTEPPGNSLVHLSKVGVQEGSYRARPIISGLLFVKPERGREQRV